MSEVPLYPHPRMSETSTPESDDLGSAPAVITCNGVCVRESVCEGERVCVCERECVCVCVIER